MVIAAQPGIFYRSKKSQYNMNLLLAVDAPQWVLFGVLVLVIILAPIFMGMRNKKENQ